MARYATRYPQTAYAGLTKSLQQEWTYVQRVTPGIEDAFAPVEKALREQFLPALFGLGDSKHLDAQRALLALPTRQGGMGIPDPTKRATPNFDASTGVCGPLVESLVDNEPRFDMRGYVKNAKQLWEAGAVARA